MRAAVRMIARVLRERGDPAALDAVRAEAAEMVAAFPAHPPDFPGHV